MTDLLGVYPPEVRDGINVFQSERLWITGHLHLHLEVFDCGLYSAVILVRSNGFDNYTIRSCDLDLRDQIFPTTAKAIRWARRFVRDWMQCEADDQEEAHEAALQRGDYLI